MNLHSSRSHTIFQVAVEQKPASTAAIIGSEDGAEPVITRAKLNLVDLAGSEKIKTYQNFTDERIAELTSINQSLSNLGNCIRALSEKGRSHVPYRNSKLTRLLEDSLGGNTKTAFIVTMSPAISAAEETISTLQFAERAKKVVVHASVNQTLDDASLVRKYEFEITRLKEQLREANQRVTTLNAGGQLAGPPSTHHSGFNVAGDAGGVVSTASASEDRVRLQHARQQLDLTRDELLDVKEALWQCLDAAAASTDRSEATEAVRALRAQERLLAKRNASIETRQRTMQEQEVRAARYHNWLLAVRVTAGDTSRGDDESEASSRVPRSAVARRSRSRTNARGQVSLGCCIVHGLVAMPEASSSQLMCLHCTVIRYLG